MNARLILEPDVTPPHCKILCKGKLRMDLEISAWELSGFPPALSSQTLPVSGARLAVVSRASLLPKCNLAFDCEIKLSIIPAVCVHVCVCACACAV